MFFELTDTIIDDIIFSMEDQGGEWFFDSKNKSVASREMMDEAGLEDNVNEEDFYELPHWKSDDGFELMEDFTKNLHAPEAHHDLREALSGGRGVFRNFKNVLKKYPEIEHRWFLFKNDRMKKRVIEWYDSLRESWGLEKLAEEFSDENQETDELLAADFIFSDYDFETSGLDVERGIEMLAQGDSELDMTELFLFKRHSTMAEPAEKSGFVCRTQSGEFAGCLLFSNCLLESEGSVIITDFFVAQNYRGLGIGRMLLSKSLASLTDRGIHFCYASGMLVPETFRLTFEQFGFKKNGPGFTSCISEQI
ncbi:MAG: GNAT family N-acetyltransferase [Treponema sp.]|nr:GNAT family N-acetyltransferase [Treponema sp.]